jgi:hypothetical protein
MSIKNQRTLLLTIAVCVFALIPLAASGQTTIGYAGGGVIQAGDVWESFLPQGFVPSYSDAGTYTTLGWRTFLRMGNFDRGWSTPGTHWPAAYSYTPYWLKNAQVFVYDTSSTFNPEKIGGLANPSYFAAARPTGTTNLWSNFAQLTYSEKLSGAVAQVGTTIKTSARNYTKEAWWVDGTRRQHQVYEAAWPTNVGIDCKMRAHGFQGPNWNNLNDFVIVEVELKNTGNVDMNMDGVFEQVNHDIQALALQVTAEAYMSVSSYGGGGRNNNDIVPSIIARQACWIDDVDENGEPWAFFFYRTAPTTGNGTTPPTAGNWDFGFNGGNSKNYTDVYTGWVILDAKIGGLPTDANRSTSTLPTKYTTFGTHPIGIGPQRGWFVSGQTTVNGITTGNPMHMFYAGTAAFYTDCGKSFDTKNFDLFNLSPNANMFSGGTAGNPLTFVTKPEASWTRPNGSMQATGLFDQVSTEDGKADATTNYPTGYGKWNAGASHTENFNGDAYSGIGPFSIKKDSTITLVFATVAGYRLEGIQKAVRAARWTYQQDFVIPQLPALPDMKVSNTLSKSTMIEWDNKAEADAEFAGYKIYRSSQFKKLNWLDEGMRVVDKYQEQMTVGARPASVYKPVNPKFDAFAKTQSTTLKGTYQPDTWGTWDLIKVIPKAEIANYKPAITSGYASKYEDKDVILGFSYWYYVAAYKEGTYTGPGGETTNRIETHSTNRNGATGLWPGTWPFAFNNVNYPKDAAGLKAIGATQIVYSALAPKGDVSTVGVRPNPYKRAALHDNRTLVYDHKILFYNLPPQAKITILDVAGQVIDVIQFASSDASKGSVFWDMFSKDGIEVASGVYVYVVESPTGSKTGYFSILR